MRSRMIRRHRFHGGIDLGGRTSMGVGGVATRFAAPTSVEAIRQMVAACRREGTEPFILGGGCNTIFPDGAFSRPVIHTEKLRAYSIDGRRVRAEAGLRIESLIRIAIECGLAGLERFRGIPGTVGGAVAMNAGGSGREFGEFVRSITAIDPDTGGLITLPGREVRWEYRRADLHGLIVVAAELELLPGDTERLRREAVEFLRWKSSTQPLGSHNAGCVFRNPTGHSAGWLIDRAGLKGRRVGSAVVSPRHANFIVNERGRATARDVRTLIDIVRGRVRELFDVELELEVVMPEQGHAGAGGPPRRTIAAQ